MWTKLRNVVLGVTQFKHALRQTSSEKRGATLSTAGENGIFRVTVEFMLPLTPH